jgi:hypothetical protein
MVKMVNCFDGDAGSLPAAGKAGTMGRGERVIAVIARHPAPSGQERPDLGAPDIADIVKPLPWRAQRTPRNRGMEFVRD